MPGRQLRRPAAAIAAAVVVSLVPVWPAAAGSESAAAHLQRGDVASGGPREAWLDHADGLVVRPTTRGASPQAITNAAAGLSRAEAAVGRPVGGDFRRIDLDRDLPIDELEAMAAALVRDGLVESAEPDYRVFPMVVPNDPRYGEQWHLHGRWPGGDGVGIDVEAAWAADVVGSADVVVAVIDTGSLPHPDLEDRLVPGYDMITSVATARDDDGRDPDPRDEGDWVGQNECGSVENPHPARSSSWHGLHVAGTIGASTGNAMGVAGIDQAAKIQHVRVLGRCGGSMSDVADAVRWAAGGSVVGVPDNGSPARVLNLSLGSRQSCAVYMQDAVDVALGLGATVVAAAGNDQTDEVASPAGCDGVISVAATSPVGGRGWYSNFGDGVGIAAPGGDHFFGSSGMVLSTHNGGATTPDLHGWTYRFMQGTSMAAPHVSGVVSLVLSANPDLTPTQIAGIIQATAQEFPVTPDPPFRCSSDLEADHPCGAGVVDAGAAVAAAQAPVMAPTLTATAGPDRGIELGWVPDGAMLGPATYDLYRHEGPDARCATTGIPIATGDDTTFVDEDRVHGQVYRYCVTATQGADVSIRSNIVTVAADDSTAPPAPPTLSAANGDRRVTLSWNTQSHPSQPITYRLYRSTGSSCSASSTLIFATTTATSRTDAGLKHGTRYRYCMTARDAADNTSALSNIRSVVAEDRTAPAAPTLLASPGDRRIELSWSASSDPTGPVTYRLYRSTGSSCSTSSTRVYQGTGRSFTDTGLSRSRSYRYCITATDGAGNGSAVAATTWATAPRPCEGWALAGDWDGSGRTGQGWWCDGRARLVTAEGGVHEFSYGRRGDVPVVADWNGDGKDTVSVIRDGTWHVNNRLRGGASERTFIYGRVSRGDVPIAGAWDGGKRDLPGIVRDREWHLRNSPSGGGATWRFVYGRLTAGDLPLWGDWNGNGTATAGIVRHGTWHLRNRHAAGSSDISYVYGRVLAGDRPVVGDWNGDGKDTPGIVRGSAWHLRHVHAAGPADRTIRFPPP